MAEQPFKIEPPTTKFPFRSAILALVAVTSAGGLFSDRELIGLATGAEGVDIFGTFVDAAFIFFTVSTLLRQAGVIKEDPKQTSKTLDGLECQVTLSIGREPGTWMPKDWGESGARLSLPLKLRFSDEVVDLGVPGEDTINGGARYAKRLFCEGGSFVSAQGAQTVACSGGAWATQAGPVPGSRLLSFFLDFPEEATRNDVTLPAGRVFFSGACWDSEKDLPSDLLAGGRVDLPNGEEGEMLAAPGGGYVLTKGGLSIRRNDWRNLWGTIGDVMLILGRYTLSGPPKPEVDLENETPMQRAERERAEDAARGRRM
jgi:hypothetical protein